MIDPGTTWADKTEAFVRKPVRVDLAVETHAVACLLPMEFLVPSGPWHRMEPIAIWAFDLSLNRGFAIIPGVAGNAFEVLDSLVARFELKSFAVDKCINGGPW